MITFCSKCGINWASLWSDQSEEDNIDYCPQCITDMYLEPGNDIIAYIKCPFSGKITNTQTGATWEQDHPELQEKPRYRIKVGRPPGESFEEKQAREEAAIDAYTATGDKNIYHQTIKKVK